MRNCTLFGLALIALSAPLHAAPSAPALDLSTVQASAEVKDIFLKRRSSRWEVHVEATRPVSFSARTLPQGRRFYVDFPDCRLAVGEPSLSINKDEMTVRVSQFSVDPAVVRVVVQSHTQETAALTTPAPATNAVISLPTEGQEAQPLPRTRIEISPLSRTATRPRLAMRPGASLPPSRSSLASRGGFPRRMPLPDPLPLPEATEIYDENPVPADGDALNAALEADLPGGLIGGVQAALAGNRRYVWGGETPNGFDCSGMMQFIYRMSGLSLPRTAAEQFKVGEPVEAPSDLQPGDLIFFTNGKRIFHVGLYIGNGLFFHASNPRRGLAVDPLSKTFYATRFAGGRRHLY